MLLLLFHWSLALNCIAVLGFSNLLLKSDFSTNDAEGKKNKYSPSVLVTRTITISLERDLTLSK